MILFLLVCIFVPIISLIPEVPCEVPPHKAFDRVLEPRRQRTSLKFMCQHVYIRESSQRNFRVAYHIHQANRHRCALVALITRHRACEIVGAWLDQVESIEMRHGLWKACGVLKRKYNCKNCQWQCDLIPNAELQIITRTEDVNHAPGFTRAMRTSNKICLPDILFKTIT